MPTVLSALPAVLFDLDGTLIDTIGVIVDSYRHTLITHGIDGVGDDELLRWIGMSLDETFEMLRPAEAAAMVATYRGFNLAHHDGRVSPYPGADALLGELLMQGRKVGVVTSKGRDLALHGLELTGVRRTEVLLGKEDTVRHKPHPEPLHRALELLGVRPEEAVYIGDAVTDLRAAAAAGVAGVGVTWGAGVRADLEAEKPAAVVDSMDELAELLLPAAD